MTTFAPPVHRDSFLYSSVLYADAGNQNRHPRATIADLHALLRPDTTKKKSKNVKSVEPIKDQVGHWYTAQLIHYGLPPTKDKNAAKVRLLNALNEGKLEVPSRIMKLEIEMKKEWEAANRKLKKATQGSKGSDTVPTPAEKKARKEISHGTPSIQGKRKREDTDEKTPTDGKKPRPKQKKADTPKALARPIWAAPASESPIKKEKNIKETMQPSPNIKSERGDESHRRDVILSGTYNITCPSITDMFSEYCAQPLHLSLLLDDQRGVWWISFSWWTLDFVIQMNPGPSYETLGHPCSLGWRLRDRESGELTFGRRCAGEMTLNKDRTMRAALYNVPLIGTVEFWGRRMPGPRSGGMTGDVFQREWDTFVTEAYGRY